MVDFIKNKYIEIDINFHSSIGLGINLGVNRFIKRKPVNFYIEIDILCWTFGLEFKYCKNKNGKFGNATLRKDEWKHLDDAVMQAAQRRMRELL